MTSPIALRRPDPDPESADSRRLWEWRMDPLTQQMSRSAGPIPWEAHKDWYATVGSDPRKLLLIATADETELGMVRFDRIADDHAEVSINMNPAMRGKGQGRVVLEAACNYGFEHFDINRIYAEIKPDNFASIKIFEGIGFVIHSEHDGLRGYMLARRRAT